MYQGARDINISGKDLTNCSLGVRGGMLINDGCISLMIQLFTVMHLNASQ